MHRVLRPRHGLAALKLGEVWQYRELMFFLAWRDVLARYKQTVIGVLWAFVRPLVTLIVLTVIFGRLAKLPSGSVPYPLLALAGLLPWQLFSSAFNDASSSVVGSAQLVSKVYFPRLIIPISATFTSFADFLVSLLMLVPLLFWYHVPVGPGILWLVPLIALCLFAALGSGIWFAALFVRYRDVRHAVPFLIQIGLYVSPVGFSSSIVPAKWRVLYSMNPMVGIIDGFRYALFGGGTPIYVPGLIVSIALAALMMVGGLYYFRNTERVFADII